MRVDARYYNDKDYQIHSKDDFVVAQSLAFLRCPSSMILGWERPANAHNHEPGGAY